MEENENLAPSERFSQQTEFLRQALHEMKTPPPQSAEDIEAFNPY